MSSTAVSHFIDMSQFFRSVAPGGLPADPNVARLEMSSRSDRLKMECWVIFEDIG